MVNSIKYDDKTKKKMAFYCMIVSIIYIGVGMVQFLGGILEIFAVKMFLPKLMPPDLFTGMALIVIGLVFAFGIKPLFNREDAGVSFIVGGSLLAIGFGILYLLIMISHGFMFLLQAEDFETWTFLDDLVPALWASTLTIPGFVIAWKIRNVK
ncbi:MAG: hypothetical protein ACTSX4_01800 [Candidatus Helarchaeota archaeon]